MRVGGAKVLESAERGGKRRLGVGRTAGLVEHAAEQQPRRGQAPSRVLGRQPFEALDRRRNLSQRLSPLVQSKEDVRALRAHEEHARGPSRVVRDLGRVEGSNRAIHPGQRLGIPLLQGERAPDVSRDVDGAPVALAEQRQVAVKGGAVGAFGLFMASEVALRHAEVVQQVRDRQRVRAEHLPAHFDRFALHALGLGVLIERAEQGREVVQDRDRRRVPARLRGRKYCERLAVRFSCALVLGAPRVVAAERAQRLRTRGVVGPQPGASNLDRARRAGGRPRPDR